MASRFAQQNQSSKSNATYSNRAASSGTIPNDTSSSHPSSSASKVLPILIMLDVSPSMHDNGRIEEQNIAIATLLKSLSRIDKVRKVTRVSFCLFTRGVKYTTKFMPLTELKFPASPYLTSVCPLTCTYMQEGQKKEYVLNLPQFTALKDDGTDIPDAVDTALTMMQEYVRSLPASQLQHYVPFLFFTSDGNPDLSQYSTTDREDYKRRTMETAQRMNSVCNRKSSIEDLIIPFFIGIGNAEEDYLRSFCREFQAGVQLARQNGEPLTNGEYLTFSNITEQIAQAIAQSITLRESSDKLLSRIDLIIANLQYIYD